jgi:hypothetical protein
LTFQIDDLLGRRGNSLGIPVALVVTILGIFPLRLFSMVDNSSNPALTDDRLNLFMFI